MSEDSTKYNGKLLHFTIRGEEYLLNIDIISEILQYQKVTKVPTVPDVVYGVINLRGKYVPVIDLAKRLMLDDKPPSIHKKSCIVVTECTNDSNTVTVGLLVDEVNEFIELGDTEISDPPKFGHSVSADLIKGMIHMNDDDFLVLDVDKLLDLEALLKLLKQVDSE